MTTAPPLKFCTVCASNNNRSMEAHRVLRDNGYLVRSYGTGSAVRLPGPSLDKPNVFPFGTPYTKIMEVLSTQDMKMNKANGVLEMTKRNMQIKKAPERWPYLNQAAQRLGPEEHPGFDGDLDFQIVFTCEERCFDAVVEDFLGRNYFEPNSASNLVYVFNVEIRDDHESALQGGQAILELANALNSVYKEGWVDEDKEGQAEEQAPLEKRAEIDPFEDKVPEIVSKWQKTHPQLPILHALCYH